MQRLPNGPSSIFHSATLPSPCPLHHHITTRRVAIWVEAIWKIHLWITEAQRRFLSFCAVVARVERAVGRKKMCRRRHGGRRRWFRIPRLYCCKRPEAPPSLPIPAQAVEGGHQIRVVEIKRRPAKAIGLK